MNKLEKMFYPKKKKNPNNQIGDINVGIQCLYPIVVDFQLTIICFRTLGGHDKHFEQ